MIALVMAGLQLLAQDTTQARVAEVVTQLVENGKQYEGALPSVSCEQTVHSQAVHKGKVKREVVGSGTLAVERTGMERAPFRESYRWKTVNGRELEEGRSPNYPYFVHGVFANALSFSSMDVLLCNDVLLTEEPGGQELRLDFQRKTTVDALPACATQLPGMRRTVYVDRKSGHVLRLFRTVPGEEAKKIKDVAYASVVYSPVQLGADTFWLPLRGETRNDKDEGRMQVEYSGCHRYKSTVTITGGTDVVPDPQ